MSATAGARLGIQVGTILGSIAIALGGLIHLASTARLGDSAGAGEAFMPAIIVRGTIHGMARLGAGVEAIGVAIGDIITITIPVTTRLQVDIIQTDVPLIEIIALMRVAEVRLYRWAEQWLFFLEKFRIDYKTFVFKFIEQWTCGIYP